MSIDKQLVELVVSYRYAQEHEWVVHAITGFLSAYYMEDPLFRVSRRYHELETGVHVWVCEMQGDTDKKIQRLIKRLQVDIPASQVHQRDPSTAGLPRYIIDIAETDSEKG